MSIREILAVVSAQKSVNCYKVAETLKAMGFKGVEVELSAEIVGMCVYIPMGNRVVRVHSDWARDEIVTYVDLYQKDRGFWSFVRCLYWVEEN